jgi:23S rRNA (cytidine1920-2'-O)/16S rRNA (cytidine1409-2'-O)-methyltransferase
MARTRLEVLVVERGLAPSLDDARQRILAGQIFSGTRRLTRPGEATPTDTPLAYRPPDPWVSRGAHKLLAALEAWPDVRVAGRTGIDLGASTGGFTHVLLERGAALVWAIDVGKGVLDARLRVDPRVRLLEETNARTLSAELLRDAPVATAPAAADEHRDAHRGAPSLLVADLSFVSLRAVLPSVLPLLRAETIHPRDREAPSPPPATPEAIVLLKPQFEAERHEVKRGGVVRDSAVHARLCGEFLAWRPSPGWRSLALIPSPLRGPAGNTEYLLHYRAEPGGE